VAGALVADPCHLRHLRAEEARGQVEGGVTKKQIRGFERVNSFLWKGRWARRGGN
jgi:hypothetical protein